MVDGLVPIIDTIFNVVAVLFLVRMLLQAARADFYNPICQAVVQVTEPVLRPLRMVVPGYRNIDFASFVAAALVKLVGLALISTLHPGGIELLRLFIDAIFLTLQLTLTIYFFAIFGAVILSWFAPGSIHPAALLIRQIVEPLLAPARRLIPPLGGAIDLSPIIVILALMLVRNSLLPGLYLAIIRLL